ncbi:hypothetical protein M8542_39985 [Amycolatopsis sp. OK19-0408]|uniref:Uncharacterized protein n=1 Tax=Amycolatopsis iheyensis TaxID=2945988 RepID=A0A9X2NJP0_9PSEU|nr:hypothetical protein [Amycolatopsis iheyensis]MCR6489027.1 hypothetical protein [Amycolatopsis iheyensis]
MTMTDLAPLTLPEWAVPTAPRRQSVEEHRIGIQAKWWRTELDRRGLPGERPAGPCLTRAEVWAPADDVFTLLWRTLAWGSGSHLRLNARRLDSIKADVHGAEAVLTEAAEASRRDPAYAFDLLRPGQRNRFRAFGPSFFTKFLYFAGGGDPDHPCLILDRVVATALRDHCGWESLHRAGPWPAVTYERYCTLLARWATTAGHAADELELTLFTSGCRAAWSTSRTLPPAAPTRPA